MKRLLPLAGIEVFVWSVLLLSTLLISRLAFTINLGNSSILYRIATETIRVLVSGIIVLIWLFVWKKVTDFYFWRAIARSRSTAQKSSER